MMKKSLLSFVSLLLTMSAAMTLTACLNTDDTIDLRGFETVNSLQLETADVHLDAQTLSKTVKLAASGSWTITQDSGWDGLSITPTQGTGSATLTITSTANQGTEARKAQFTIKVGDHIKAPFYVTQEVTRRPHPTDIHLTATPSALTFLYFGGEQNVVVTCNTKWYAQSSVNWLKVNGYSSYPNDVKSDDDETWANANTSGFSLTIKAEENQDPVQKEGTILLRALDKAETVAINVTIGGKNAYITVSPDNTIDVPAVGQDILYSVSSNFNWQATISAEDSYATFKQNNSTIFNGTASTEAENVVVSVIPNTSEQPRTITINFGTLNEAGTPATQTLTLNQAAGTKPVITGAAVTDITRNSANVKFNVSTTSLAVTECGIYFSKNRAEVENRTAAPVKLDQKDGDIVHALTDLSHGEPYYVLIYAVNDVGTTYSEILDFQTLVIPDDTDNPPFQIMN